MTSTETKKIAEKCVREFYGIKNNTDKRELREIVASLQFEEVVTALNTHAAKANEQNDTWMLNRPAVFSCLRAIKRRHDSSIAERRREWKMPKQPLPVPWPHGQLVCFTGDDGTDDYGWVCTEEDDGSPSRTQKIMEMHFFAALKIPGWKRHRWVPQHFYAEAELSKYRPVDGEEAAGLIRAWARMEEDGDLKVEPRMPRG